MRPLLQCRLFVFALVLGGIRQPCYRPFVLLAAGLTGSLLGGAPDWLPTGIPAHDAEPGTLCTRSYFSEEEGARVLQAALEQFEDEMDWTEAFDCSRGKILEGAGLSPLPARVPLHPVLHSERHYKGYRVVNVAFVSVPGYWVTGNLYLPDNLSDPVPAVLHTHGHSGKVTDSGGWERHGRFKADVQYRAATLARMGAVSLTIDMFGYGDSTVQFGPDAHRHEEGLAVQLWNAIRAIDFLESLPYVDPARIAVTGHSGGATQAFLLTAVDHRVAVSVPVSMVSAHFFGGCPCESGKPIHLSEAHFVSNPMIAAMAAPRPQLLVSVGGDWTLNTPEVEFPFLQEVYRDFGAAEDVANVHLADEGHNYGKSKRMAVYPFLARHLLLDASKVLNSELLFDESAVTIESPDLMRVFDEDHPLPSDDLRSGDEVHVQLRRLQASAGSLEVSRLRCMDRLNPVGVSTSRPEFSWQLRSDGTNKRQTAWQVQVAGKREDLLTGKRLYWDSGRREGAAQRSIAYEGPILASSGLFWWRVRVWDETGRAGPWSEAARVVTGLVDADDWNGRWITHPDWLEFNRPHLGYRSEAAESVDSPKWIELDLGKSYPVDGILLRALRHTVAERLGFPMQFRVLGSTEASFREAVVLMDCIDNPLNKWRSTHRIDADGKAIRFIRLEVPILRDLDGTICLALSQIEVLSGGENVAVGARLQASDSVEDGPWALSALVDGRGAGGANPVANETLILEREFTLEEVPEAAVAHIAGLGTYVFRLNGQRVGNRKLSPGWTDTEKRVLYDSYLVESLLRVGKNRIEIELAGGMYSVPSPQDRYTKFVGRFNPLKAIFQLDEVGKSGKSLLVSDASWLARKGSTSYSHVYGGEDVDLRRNALKAGEGAVHVAAPGGKLLGVEFAADPIRTRRILTAEKLPTPTDLPRIYDLGQNASVMIRLYASGPAGSIIRVTPSELLDESGGLSRGSSGGGRAYWEVTLDGSGLVQWESEFFYHGSRYLQVETLPVGEGEDLPRVYSLEGLVTHSSAPEAGRFRSSNGLFNATHELIRWAQRSNMMSVLTDCPHRERLGWLEQYHLNGPSIRYAFDLKRHYQKTLADMRDGQTMAGLVPNIVPEYIVFEGAFRDSPEWGSAIILAAWQQYLFHGDVDVLRENLPAMETYIGYLGTRACANLLSHGLGDWYDLGPERPGFAQLTPPEVTGSATYFEACDVLAKICDVLGLKTNADKYRKLSEQNRAAFNERFFDTEKGCYWPGSQTAQAMPIAIGLSLGDVRAAVAGHLIHQLESTDAVLTSGDVGHRYLLRALSGLDRDDLINAMHSRSDRPGYGYQLLAGATSLLESWDANTHASQNHFMLGHVMEWFYAGLAGIRPDPSLPGFRQVIVDPQWVAGLDWAMATHSSDFGDITSRWRLEDGLFQLTVTIPPNAHAKILSPLKEGASREVGSGTWEFEWDVDK